MTPLKTKPAVKGGLHQMQGIKTKTYNKLWRLDKNFIPCLSVLQPPHMTRNLWNARTQ